MHIDKPQSFWENVLWIEETKLELFVKTHQLYVHRRKNETHQEKNTVPTVKHGGGLVLFWGFVLLHLAQDVLNLCKIQWNLKTVKVFWNKMCCLVSKTLVSVVGHGSSNRIMTQKHSEKHWRITKNKTLDCSEVFFCEPRSQFY
ncbi:hypothetical protein NL108_017089 [Boleophthalmus pectinirostris]|nr:hypothetical protein NL108_017089 [Boleophthalmus pectinirostris]